MKVLETSAAVSPESSGRYLSPEPMLQEPQWVRDEAQDGFSTPTYAYARNNPLRYVDPTGLFSWIAECEGAGVHVWAELNYEGGEEGVGRTVRPALRFEPTPGRVQFDSQHTNACQDVQSARTIQTTYLTAYGPQVVRCWRLMIRQMDDACNREQGPQPPKPVAPSKPGKSLTCER